MKLLRTYLCLLGLAFVFQSCESDSPDNSAGEVVLTGYKITGDSQFINVPGINTSKSVTTVLLSSNRLVSKRREVFVDGIRTEVRVIKRYIYRNGMVTDMLGDQSDELRRDLHFYYDANAKLAGSKMFTAGQNSHYRFVHINENVSYMEKLSAPYNDATAQILRRNIVVFDNRDNIVQAGVDMNLDGVAENVNYYTYSSDNNLQHATVNGTHYSFQYSTMINNKGFIEDVTFGKRNLRLINTELYSYGMMVTNETYFNESKNLFSSEETNGTYELRSDNFVKKHISTESVPERTTVTTTEYFFR